MQTNNQIKSSPNIEVRFLKLQQQLTHLINSKPIDTLQQYVKLQREFDETCVKFGKIYIEFNTIHTASNKVYIAFEQQGLSQNSLAQTFKSTRDMLKQVADNIIFKITTLDTGHIDKAGVKSIELKKNPDLILKSEIEWQIYHYFKAAQIKPELWLQFPNDKKNDPKILAVIPKPLRAMNEKITELKNKTLALTTTKQEQQNASFYNNNVDDFNPTVTKDEHRNKLKNNYRTSLKVVIELNPEQNNICQQQGNQRHIDGNLASTSKLKQDDLCSALPELRSCNKIDSIIVDTVNTVKQDSNSYNNFSKEVRNNQKVKKAFIESLKGKNENNPNLSKVISRALRANPDLISEKEIAWTENNYATAIRQNPILILQIPKILQTNQKVKSSFLKSMRYKNFTNNDEKKISPELANSSKNNLDWTIANCVSFIEKDSRFYTITILPKKAKHSIAVIKTLRKQMEKEGTDCTEINKILSLATKKQKAKENAIFKKTLQEENYEPEKIEDILKYSSQKKLTTRQIKKKTENEIKMILLNKKTKKRLEKQKQKKLELQKQDESFKYDEKGNEHLKNYDDNELYSNTLGEISDYE
jgi:hypothetical protein